MPKTSRKWLVLLVVVLALAFLIYRSSGAFHLGEFSGRKLLSAVRSANPFLLGLSLIAIYGCYALRAARWRIFQGNIGRSRFMSIYAMTLAGFGALFLLGRVAEPVRPILLARKEKLPTADIFGVYFLERIFDTASTAVIAAIGLLLVNARSAAGESAGPLRTAARTTGSLLFAGVLFAVAVLVYLRLHGTALLERRLEPWRTAANWKAKVAGALLGLVRGVQAIRSWGELLLAVLLSAAHWFLVLLIYLWVSHAFGEALNGITLGDAMLVMAFTLVGSAVQLPGVGGGSQVASFLAYTTIFGVEKEPAAAAAIVIWLITFAAVALVGVPLLIHEGLSLGQLKEMAEHERDELQVGEVRER
jgi:glycosyltransferase 2 family protein